MTKNKLAAFRTGLFTMTVLLFLTAYRSPQKDVQIVWGSKVITWDDFKGPYNRKSSGIASTYSYMDMEIGKTGVVLKAVFDTEESWVVYKEASVLKHERGHFDITELYARKLRKKIAGTVFSKDNYKNELWKLYGIYDDLMDKYHDKYDDETESSMNTPKQKAWEAGIKKDIEALNDYRSIEVPLKFAGN